jgi:predicted nucleic acid-binding protein
LTTSLYFLDTSAILKRYVAEIGSAWVVQLCETQSLAVSTLTYAELASALARSVREGRIDDLRLDEILRTYRGHVRDVLQIGLRAYVLEDAVSLLIRAPATIGRRALDAIQIACARRALAHVKDVRVDTVIFASADQRLLAAARWIGLTTDNPEDHP